MAPITKLDDSHPAVSLMLIKPAPKETSPDIDNLTPAVDPSSNGDDQTSRAALMQMVFALLIFIGENMSKIQQVYSQSQQDLVTMSQAQVAAANAAQKELDAKLAELEKKEAEAKKWQTFGTVMKWIGVAVALILAAALCETGIGFALMVAVIAFTASPLFDMAVNKIKDDLVKDGMSPQWAQILAGVIVLVVVAVASLGTEAAAAGISRFAATAGEEAGEEVEMSVLQNGKTVANDATDNASSAATKAPFVTAASTQSILQTLTSSGLVTQLLEQIPGIKKYPWLVAILSVLITLTLMLAALKVTPTSGGNMLQSAGKSLSGFGGMQKIVAYFSTPSAIIAIKSAFATFAFATQAGTSAAEIGASDNEMEQGKTRKKIAPIQAQLMISQALMKILVDIETLVQQNARSMITKNDTLFGINFSGDMKGCITAQVQG